MPRNHARVYTSIWHDEDWRALPWQAQWAYELALTQPGLSYAGVVSYTPKRWAKMAEGLEPEFVEQAVERLAAGRFVIVDIETDELLVRSFVKNDGILQSPNLIKAMWKAFDEIVSVELRQAFLKGFPKGFPEGQPKPIREAFTEGQQERFGNPRRKASRARTRAPHPLPQPPPQPVPDNTLSSRHQTNGGRLDDETTPKVILDAFRVLAERHLEERNDAEERRPKPDIITGKARREGWLAKDIQTSRETLAKVARLYLDDQPTMTAVQLADALSDRIIDTLASSPLGAA